MKHHGNYVLPTAEELAREGDAAYVHDVINRLRMKAKNTRRHNEKCRQRERKRLKYHGRS